MPKISVIIPVFGVEKYIERCARSLFSQTLDEIEYLFIDDCTPDKSIEVLMRVLDDFPHRKSQVIVHRMEKNSGQAKVREWGMTHASGEFIIHCDSDDWVDTNLYQLMYKKAVDEKSDVVVCDCIMSDGDKTLKTIDGGDCQNKGAFVNAMLIQKFPWALWNKLFNREHCLKDLIYPTGNMGEDMALCIQQILNANQVSHVKGSFYYYFYNMNSIMNTWRPEKSLLNFESLKSNVGIVESVLKEQGLYNELDYGITQIRFNSLIQLFPYTNIREHNRRFRNTYPSMVRRVIQSPHIPLTMKIRYILSYMKIYPAIRSVLR